MNHLPRKLIRAVEVSLLICSSRLVFAGPPFITDDPEPVDLKHWEVYLFGTYEHAPEG